MRAGEVLETVPGLVISQHSGEGKANQYYLRGFNLDHGTDFATMVAGIPVNMPTHGHGHGYSDANFLIPELVSGVQFAKGPYFAEQGDFATAGSANINYANVLEAPIVRVGGGDQGFARAFAAASPRLGRRASARGARSAAQRRAVGAAGRLSARQRRGALYRRRRGEWAVDHRHGVSRDLELHRSGAAAGDRRRDHRPLRHASTRPTAAIPIATAASVEWQRSRRNASTKIVAYGLAYDLNLFSNFTFFLDDPDRGDQFHQADHRFVSGARISHRRISRFFDREMQNTVGLQLRNDDITNVGLYHTQARQLIEHRPAGRCAADQPVGVCPERNLVDAEAAHAGRSATGRLSLPRQLGRSGEQWHGAFRDRQPQGRAWWSVRSAAPSSTPTPASGSTATMRVARPSGAIRRPGKRSIRSRRWCGPRERRSASGRSRCRTCRRP